MEYSSPEDEEALLPGMRTTVPPSRSLTRTVVTGVLIVATIVCSGFLVSLSTGSSAKSSSKNGASLFQSVQTGNYIDHNKFIAKVKPTLNLTLFQWHDTYLGLRTQTPSSQPTDVSVRPDKPSQTISMGQSSADKPVEGKKKSTHKRSPSTHKPSEEKRHSKGTCVFSNTDLFRTLTLKSITDKRFLTFKLPTHSHIIL